MFVFAEMGQCHTVGGPCARVEMVLRFGLSRVIAMAQLHAGDQLQPNKFVELGT